MDMHERQLRNEDVLSTVEEHSRGNRKWSSVLVHWWINLCVLAAAGGFGFAIYTILSFRTYNQGSGSAQEWSTTNIELMTSVAIAFVLNTFSPTCAWITSYQSFRRTRERVYVTVYR